MKIAVYSISKNEEKFVKRWAESAKDADYILLADTGSTDDTVKIAESIGVNVFNISVQPWRFDDARNASLALVPPDIDYCIPLDLDEVLVPGWREALERELGKGITRPRYKFVWSWNGDKPEVYFYGDKIHARSGFRWRHPVHEVIYATGEPQIESFSEDLQIHHYPDPEKSRGQYLPLLELSVTEDPNNDRNAYYYARELFYYDKHEEAIREFQRFLTLSGWDAERGSAYRYMAKCTDNFEEKVEYLNLALKEATRREAYMDLAILYYDRQMWAECLNSIKKLLEIEYRPIDYISEAVAWNGMPYDIGAVAAHAVGDLPLAIDYVEKALSFTPDDERLKANYDFLRNQSEDSSIRDSEE